MENATDALKMAAAVFVFVLALSISINAFGEARKSAQIILDNRDREYDYTYVEENGETQRIVGIETMIPSIYKAYKENYKIVFKDKSRNGIPLYQKLVASNSTEKVNISSIDLEKDVLGSDKQKEKFIKALLYGPTSAEKVEFQKLGIFLKDEGFYKRIKNENMKFQENLGVYYQEEVQGQSNTTNANKTIKRVITYVEI